MSSGEDPRRKIAEEVRGCLCLHLQRAARAVARRFDQAFRPFDLTNWQFSLLTSLDLMQQPTIGKVADLLGMDRTTLTANLKPLERRRLVAVELDDADKRIHRLGLTPAGRELLEAAVPVWRETHSAVERLITDSEPESLRVALRLLSASEV